MFQKDFPEVRDSRLKAGRYELIHPARDELISRQPQQLAGAEAGIQASAVVVGDENRLGRVVEDGPQQQLEFSGTVFGEPLGVLMSDVGAPHAIFPGPTDQGAQAPERGGTDTENIPQTGWKPRMAVSIHSTTAG
jgi:hypothetical protein